MNNLRLLIRNVIAEVGRSPVKVSASQEYMKKENVRQELQDMIAEKVVSGEITDQTQLDEWFKTVTMALNALKMVPIEAYSPKKRARAKKGLKINV